MNQSPRLRVKNPDVFLAPQIERVIIKTEKSFERNQFVLPEQPHMLVVLSAERCFSVIFDLRRFVVFGEPFVKPCRSICASEIIIKQKMRVIVKNCSEGFYFIAFDRK